MNNDKLQTYSVRVTQANRSELVVIMYEIIIEAMESAKMEHDAAGHGKAQKEMKRAQKFLNELIGSLDYRCPVSLELLSLYSYVNKRIVTAIVKKNTLALDSAISVMRKLMTAFQSVAAEDQTGPLMENTQKLYAGLTYGKGTLNEMLVSRNEYSRGYKA